MPGNFVANSIRYTMQLAMVLCYSVTCLHTPLKRVGLKTKPLWIAVEKNAVIHCGTACATMKADYGEEFLGEKGLFLDSPIYGEC